MITKMKTDKVKNNLIKPTIAIRIIGCIVVLLRLELGQYLEASSNLTENDNAAGILEIFSTQSKYDGKEHSGQNQHQFLQNYKYRRKQDETKTKYCAGHLPTCSVVVSDTGYGIDLLYKQDKFGSLITAVRFQEQIDNSEEKKRVRPESKLKHIKPNLSKQNLTRLVLLYGYLN